MGFIVDYFVLVVIFVATLASVVVRFVRRSYVARPRPQRSSIVESSLGQLALRDAILRAAQGSRFEIEEDVPEKGLITLHTNPSWFTWGFFIPIWLDPLPGGGTRAVVGIESKLFQLGPVVSRWHRKALTVVERAAAA